MTAPNPPRLRADQLDPGLATLITQLDAFETVDLAEMYIWARPRLDDLRYDFYHSGEHTEDFPLWLRCRYLNRKSTIC